MDKDRNFAAELNVAREAGDWAAHERIWEERRVARVEAEEASVAEDLIRKYEGK